MKCLYIELVVKLGVNTFDKIVKANILASKPLWHPIIRLRETARERGGGEKERDSLSLDRCCSWQ